MQTKKGKRRDARFGGKNHHRIFDEGEKRPGQGKASSSSPMNQLRKQQANAKEKRNTVLRQGRLKRV